MRMRIRGSSSALFFVAALALRCARGAMVTAETTTACPKTSPCCTDLFEGVNGMFESLSVEYGMAENLDGFPTIPLYMDVYEATALRGQPKPVMIVVHGGGFMSSSSKRLQNTIEECRGWARRGFLALAIEYRRWMPTLNAGGTGCSRFFLKMKMTVLTKLCGMRQNRRTGDAFSQTLCTICWPR